MAIFSRCMGLNSDSPVLSPCYSLSNFEERSKAAEAYESFLKNKDYLKDLPKAPSENTLNRSTIRRSKTVRKNLSELDSKVELCVNKPSIFRFVSKKENTVTQSLPIDINSSKSRSSSKYDDFDDDKISSESENHKVSISIDEGIFLMDDVNF